MSSSSGEYYERANGTRISKQCVLEGVENIEIGAKSFVSDNAVLDASHGIIRIGERTYIGPHVHIRVSSSSSEQQQNNNNNTDDNEKEKKKPVCVIGSGVWVGDRTQLHNCWIGPGARIGMDTRIDTDVVVQEKAHVEHGSWITEGTTVPNNAYYSDR